MQVQHVNRVLTTKRSKGESPFKHLDIHEPVCHHRLINGVWKKSRLVVTDRTATKVRCGFLRFNSRTGKDCRNKDSYITLIENYPYSDRYFWDEEINEPTRKIYNEKEKK